MPTKWYKVSISTNNIGSEVTDYFELPEQASEPEIEAEARQVAFNMLDWSYTEKSNDGDVKLYEVSVSTTMSQCIDDMEVSAQATADEIEAEAREIAFDMVDWYYKEVSAKEGLSEGRSAARKTTVSSDE